MSSSQPSLPDLDVAGGGMQFNVDGWEPEYGQALDMELQLAESRADVDPDIEVPQDRWRPIAVDPAVTAPRVVLFVDGVRRVDARVWIDEPIGADGVVPTAATAGVCASYAAGVVCCCEGKAHVIAVELCRGMFTIAPHATDVHTRAGTYQACFTVAKEGTPLPVTLSSAVQERLAGVELRTANRARSSLAGHVEVDDDLLVVDGPLRAGAHLDRAVGYIKSHHSEYLSRQLNSVVGSLGPRQRTPVFRMVTTWDRYSWYLRLPCAPAAPWAGVIRVEASVDLVPEQVFALANLTQVVLPRYASAEYKDARAPQNLYPIGGLEKDLRHKLGDQQLLYRALRQAAAM
ncbi:hypothetical protein [Jatrophihabitans sp.]|uniref:hypothetical protein n=1 Tax=Jatrophihabitans sp. TaxID=1932789 RepID=UPI002CAC520A|nr:hypothetical protein [Jatrophihabitans sp.]